MEYLMTGINHSSTLDWCCFGKMTMTLNEAKVFVLLLISPWRIDTICAQCTQFLKFVFWLDLQVPGEIVHTWSFSCYYKLCWCLASSFCYSGDWNWTAWINMLIHVWWGNHYIKCTWLRFSEKHLVLMGNSRLWPKFLGMMKTWGQGTGFVMLVVHQAILIVPKMIM